MRFDDRYLEEIKSRLKLSDVIGRSVKLRRAGREWVGLSPFAKEKTPSFYVNDEKGFYHDFSSGKHGDLLSFLQETERLSFREAVEKLAAEAGVPLPSPDPKDQAAEKRRQGLGDWLELAAKWFEAELRRPVGAEARAYLERRGLPEADWSRFRLGYAPGGRTVLKDYLVSKGARMADLADTGLLIAPEDGSAPYDRFRDRIMFPITDIRGRVISFGGRALDPEAKAKYLNGPEAPLFHKGSTLYGLFEAKKLLTLAERRHAQGDGPPAALVVVEGYMDAIACQRADIPAVAPLGTALTEDQMEALWRLHPEPTLCFDGDKAGRRAAARAMERAMPLLTASRSFRFAKPTGGKDPDDVLRDQGPGALMSQMADTHPFVQHLFEDEFAKEPLDTPERRAGLKGRLRSLANQIADKDVAGAYRDELLARYDEAVRPQRRDGGPSSQNAGFAQRPFSPQKQKRGAKVWEAAAFIPPNPLPQTSSAARSGRLKPRLLPAAVAWFGLQHPDALGPYIEGLEATGFHDQALKELAREISALSVREPGLDMERLTSHLAKCGLGELLVTIEKLARESKAPFLEPGRSLEDARRIWSRTFNALIQLAEVEAALNAAKEDLARTRDATQLMRLRGELTLLENALNNGSVYAEPDA